MTGNPNFVDVVRKSNELAAEFGLGAHRHARNLAEEAQRAGDLEQFAFWTAVADELSPHCSIARQRPLN